MVQVLGNINKCLYQVLLVHKQHASHVQLALPRRWQEGMELTAVSMDAVTVIRDPGRVESQPLQDLVVCCWPGLESQEAEGDGEGQ